MKPFNLADALAGKPVMTQDGVKVVRIFYAEDACESSKVICVLETGLVVSHYKDGRYSADRKSDNDLVMAPQKKEGWINLYQASFGRVPSDTIHSSEEDAINLAKNHSWEPHEFVTIKIEWEE